MKEVVSYFRKAVTREILAPIPEVMTGAAQ
jgi:hypothetical protein